MEKGKNHHFVLVHGACHGAWCWYKVVTILRAEGHKVSVPDMAASGIHPKHTEELNSMAEYNEPLMEFMANVSQEERVVLVGHSMGGINISLAMEMFPQKICVAVFVTAFMPGPDLNIVAISQQEKGPTSLLFGPEVLATNFYQLSPSEDLTLATYLVRPVPLFGESSLLKDSTYTNEKYGSVRRVYVVCDKDNVLKEEQIQRWLIKNNPPDDVELIHDADHMVMFSKSRELCSCLLMISQKYH
ncbi:methyl jasmonate esterase 1-like isoform X2 [Nicotiana sylvestris]|uniref:Methylesterase 3 isoform X2 n=2 Tax=Nicotiana TaxID=4085 RepID=A0A1S4A8X4_TOBAC|nr:PREDICTED: methylesterase 3-like isoform X2 [Nicotiana sylvestris]XP_016473031.1 PREDICTED: methylesterase 3-like isoform X2 [Nicotiana tabacum]